MQYLTITNRGSFHRVCAEMVGLSTKRGLSDDPSTVGQFGSGSKFSPVAALRLGIDVAVSSTDDQGRYLLTYDTEKFAVQGASYHQVHFCYQTVLDDGTTVPAERKPSNWELNAYKNWNQAVGDDEVASFRVMREYVCNAIDHDKAFNIGWSNEVLIAPPGHTVVSLTYTHEMRHVLTRPDRYFKFLAKQDVPLFAAAGIGQIHNKSEPAEIVPERGSSPKPAKTRLFSQGVVVFCNKHPAYGSLFDYSLDDKSVVSEEREIRNFYKYYHGMAKIFGVMTDVHLAKVILAGIEDGLARLEENALRYVDSFSGESRAAWIRAVTELYGEKVAVASQNKVINADCEQVYGYRVLSEESDGVGQLLLRLGFPRADSIAATLETMKYDIVPYDEIDVADRQAFEAAFCMIGAYFPERTHLPIIFYYPRNLNLKKIAAFSGMGEQQYQEIWIACKTRRSIGKTEQELFHDLLHEGRHCETRAHDYERSFMARADMEVIGLIYGRTTPPGIVACKEPRLAHPTRHQVIEEGDTEVDVRGWFDPEHGVDPKF